MSDLINGQDEQLKNLPSKPFILLYNIPNSQIDKIKLLNVKGATITAINYGPFDNGYLLLGLSSGCLLAIDMHEMEVIMQAQLFSSAIIDIKFEPTNLVFVAAKKRGEVAALNLVKKEMHYVYLEMGKR
jgi:hypothetical protein